MTENGTRPTESRGHASNGHGRSTVPPGAGPQFRLRYTYTMHLDIAAVQSALAADGLDGGPGRSAPRFQPGGGHIGRPGRHRQDDHAPGGAPDDPASGQPRKLVYVIQSHNLDKLPGEKLIDAGREALAAGLDSVLAGSRRLAMEYSPEGAIPYVARVDAGTVESIRARGIEVVSSGDSASGSGVLGRGCDCDPPRGLRAPLPGQGSRVPGDCRASPGGHANDGVRRPAVDGGLDPAKRTWSATPRRLSRSMRTRGTHTTAPGRRAALR